MADPRTGTVTYLLTDVVGSTALWEQAEGAMAIAMARHDELVAGAVARSGGEVLWPRGEGDSRFAVFAGAGDALAAAAAFVRALGEEVWPTPYPLTVRAAVHTGEADHRGGLHYGPAVNRSSRLRALAHPGQVLVSGAAVAAAAGSMPNDIGVLDLGTHRMADLTEPEHVHQLLGPGLPGDFPALASLDRVRHNLPRQSDDFVGRDLERAFLAKALEGSRLVTVTGAGGTGKTRLAVQVAAEQINAHADGVWLVELAGVEAVEDGAIFDAMARAIGVPAVPGRTPAQLVEDFLRAKTTLLVLDNCEHLVRPCADVVSHLLKTAAGLRVLATSRRPLGVRGEQLWPLGPLDHPDPTHLPALEELASYDAVALFASRARSARSDFTLDAGTAKAVAEICSRLDGVPLALELAAATLRALTPAEVAERLADRFALLADAPVDAGAPVHHRSLRAALDWSWDLLAEAERVALRRLSVFMDSFELEAAEAVVAGGDVPAEAVPDTLVELVDASLLVPSYDPSTRYRLLASVRAYAEEKLAAEEQEAVHDRHLGWFAEVFEDGQRAEVKPVPSALLRRYALEANDVRAALAWGFKAHRVDGLRLAAAISYVWWSKGDVAGGMSTLPGYIDAFPDAPPRERAAALASLAFLERVSWSDGEPHARVALHLAEQDAVDEWWLYFMMCGSRDSEVIRRGYELAMARGHRDAASYGCQQLGMVDLRRGDPDAAARWFEEGYELLRADKLSTGRARLLSTLAWVTQLRGRWDEAERLFTELLELGQDLPDPISEAAASGALGGYAAGRRDFEAASSHFERQAEIGREVGLAAMTAAGMRGLSDVAVWRGDAGLARRHAEAAVEAVRAVPHMVVCFSVDLAHAALLDGDTRCARASVAEALTTSRAIGDAEHEARALVASAVLDLAAGETDRAVVSVLQGIPLFRDVAKDHVDLALQAVGMAAAVRGDPTVAVRFLAAADRFRPPGRPPWDAQGLRELEDRLRSTLDEEEFERESVVGRSWAVGTALDAATAFGSALDVHI